MVYDLDYKNKCMLMVFLLWKWRCIFGLINFISPYKVAKSSLQRVCGQLFGGYHNGEEVTIGLY